MSRTFALLLLLLNSSSAAAFSPRPVPAHPRGRAAIAVRCEAIMSHDAPQIATQIAWIGNSFVFFNKLPRMLAGMLAHDGTQVKQKDVLVGGQGLPGHSLDQNVTKLLAQQKWDFVILQDQSAVPGGADEAKFGESIAALKTYFAPRLPSAEEANRELHVIIAPVGEAFLCVHQAQIAARIDPEARTSLFSRLYAADSFHPSPLGTFLAACVFYGVITGKSPAALRLSDTPWTEEAELTPEMKQALQEFAHQALKQREHEPEERVY